jgi:thiamine biosynthesis lipoprotein
MGTILRLKVITPDQEAGKEAIERTFSQMTRLIRIFDYRDPLSPISQLNRQGMLEKPPQELYWMVQKSLEFSKLTNGAFDITVKPLLDCYTTNRAISPDVLKLVDYRQVRLETDCIRLMRPGMALTLDGIAKGYVIDEGVEALHQLDFDQVLVEAGGDLRAGKAAVNGHSWKIGIAHPRSDDAALLASFNLNGKAVATSGDYINKFTPDRRLHHILDPRTGISPLELASVTIITSDAMSADALSTALMVLGPKAGLKLVSGLDEVEALLIGKDLQIWRTPNFPI